MLFVPAPSPVIPLSWSTASRSPVARPSPPRLRFADVSTARSVTGTLLALWWRERLVAACGVLAFLLAGACLSVAVASGSWHVPPEGRLLDALKFESASGSTS